jgi:hypothetical protein
MQCYGHKQGKLCVGYVKYVYFILETRIAANQFEEIGIGGGRRELK